MSMHMNNTVYWRKNEVVVVAPKPKGTHSVDPEAIWLGINKAFTDIQMTRKEDLGVHGTSPQLKLNLTETLSLPTDFVYFSAITTTEQTKAKNSDVNDVDHALDAIRILESVNARDSFQFDAVLNWLSSNVDNTHGCPVSPPFPVSEIKGRGSYKITLPRLPDKLQRATGKGVTVFVLDTLPQSGRIEEAAEKAGDHNILLKKMVNGMKTAAPYNAKPPANNLNYSFDSLIPAPEDSARTGKDIYGRLVGFPMEDHGLAIAGIIRDLVPDANIECIRVLNDYGVGDLRTLISALDYIYNIVSQSDGSLILPVVVNLSLVLFPPEHDLHDGSLPNIEDIIATSRSILRSILNHDSFEAVFLCSVGNDCDTRDTAMNPAEVRFMARYPAAFADDKEHRIDRIIPVGAVNKERKAASYSNYPGNNGVATYGGELPKPDPWLPSALSGISRTHVDDTVPVDALCGIYTAKEYPALSVNDDGRRTRNAQMGDGSQEEAEHYPMYHAPNLRAWAYWSGTSYATPIISALAARVLEVARVDGVKENIPQVIRDLAQQRRKLWKRVIEYRAGEKSQAMNGSSEMSEPKDLDGKVILAVQDWLPEINE